MKKTWFLYASITPIFWGSWGSFRLSLLITVILSLTIHGVVRDAVFSTGVILAMIGIYLLSD